LFVSLIFTLLAAPRTFLAEARAVNIMAASNVIIY